VLHPPKSQCFIRPEVSASSAQKSVLHPPRSQCFILPEVSASALTWFVRYIYYGNLQFLNNVIINKTEVLLPQAYVTLADFGYPVLLPPNFNYLSFQYFDFELT
jgi:hypothetical protein